MPLSADLLDNDLTLVYMASRVGLEHGWSHIYSLALQQQVFAHLRPGAFFGDGERYLSPPAYAWLLVPLGVAGPRWAVVVWLSVSALSATAAWWVAAPGSGRMKVVWLIGAIAWYPLLYSAGLAQPALVVLGLVAASWRLARAGRPYLAGAVLGLTAIKPQLSLLVPVVLLFSGRWRTAATWAATAGALGLLSLLSLGPSGLSEYRTLLEEAQSVSNNRYFTYAYVVGGGAASYAVQACVAVVAAIGGRLNRGATDGRLYALGLVATVIGATYWHLQDFTILVLAAWLFCRERTPAWQQLWLVVVAFTGEFAWGFTPLPLLAAITVWLGFLVAPQREEIEPGPVTVPAS